MKRVLGIICMLLGISLVASSAWLLIHNRAEDENAQKAKEEYLPLVMDAVKEITEESRSEQDISSTITHEIPKNVHDSNFDYVGNMLVTHIAEYDFIGYISIPNLELQLPVMSETKMELMKIAPCRFSGSPKTNDLVIGAHNYQSHFGNIDDLVQGNKVYFTDMEGVTWEYEVEFTEILSPNEADELQNGEFPLTIYTCTYDGSSRITVRCNRAK